MKLFYTTILVLSTLISIGQGLNDGLEGYWSFDGHANDESPNGNNGTVHGATLTPDRHGNLKAYYFDGSDDYIDINGTHNYSFGNSASIFLWARLDDQTKDYQHLLNFDSDNAGRAVVFILDADAGAIRSGFRTKVAQSNSGFIGNQVPILDGEWHALCYTSDGTSGKLYIDGNLDNTNSFNFSVSDFTANGFIGCHPSISNFFKGAIDEVRLYNRVLSEDEIKFLSDVPTQQCNNMACLNGDVYVQNKLGINTLSIPNEYSLAVKGRSLMESIEIKLSGNWPDYVFNPDYDLKPLEEVETFIHKNKHLPSIPNETDVLTNGLNLGEINAQLLLKIEELTLYMIEQNKKHNELLEVVNRLEKEIEELK